MKIDEAIEQLQQRKVAGTKHILFAFWEAEMFDREDDDSWADDSSLAENIMDWSHTHDQLSETINHANK